MGIYFRDRRAHCYPWRVATGLSRRTFRNIVTLGHVISGQARFGTALFQVTMYRQFARKVGTSANSALICYYLLRLRLSRSTRDRKWTNGYYLEIAFNPLDPIEISENRSEILGRSPFLTKYGSIWFFHNNLFNIEYLSNVASYIYSNQHWIAYKMV